MLNIYVYSFENMKFNLGLSLEETKHSSWPGSSCAEVKLISVQTSVLQMNQYPVKTTMFNSQNCEDMSFCSMVEVHGHAFPLILSVMVPLIHFFS